MPAPRLHIATALLLLASAAAAQGETHATNSVTQALTSLTSTLGAYVAVLAGTSGLVAGLIEAYKKIFSIRGKFHRTAVMRWLSQSPEKIPAQLQAAKSGALARVTLGGEEHYTVPTDRAVESLVGEALAYSPEQAYAELFHLTSGQHQPSEPHPVQSVLRWRGVDRAVFELETSRLMSQVQDAADAVLNNPELYPHLYAFLTRGAPPADATEWRKYISTPPETGPSKQDSDRYGRIRLLMRRQLDAFQTVTSSRWDDLNQLWAIVVGAVILFIALVIAADPKYAARDFQPLIMWCDGMKAVTAKPDLLVGVLLKAILGGALAPFASDLLKSISSIKFTK